MTVAASRSDADTPKLMYAARTAPAVLAKPAVIIACNSESVTSTKAGLSNIGDSVMLRNMFAIQLNVSTGLVPITSANPTPSLFTSQPIIPR